MYRIKYLSKSEVGASEVAITGVMSFASIKKWLKLNGKLGCEIIPDASYKLCKNCLYKAGKKCLLGNNKISDYDVCDAWLDKNVTLHRASPVASA